MGLQNIFPYKSKDTNRACRLYCFRHAGGSAFIFKNWLDFAEEVEVIPTDVPDKEKDSSIMHLEEVIEDAVQAIVKTADDRPAFFYGHSFGTLVAFKTAYRLRTEYGLAIKKLFVAGRHAPCVNYDGGYCSSQGMDALYEELKRSNAIQENILQDKLFRTSFLPAIYHDYRMSEEYQYEGEQIDIPIVALNGMEDKDATWEIVQTWKQMTAKSFEHYEFAGGHFFPYEKSEQEVLAIIKKEIIRSLEGKDE